MPPLLLCANDMCILISVLFFLNFAIFTTWPPRPLPVWGPFALCIRDPNILALLKPFLSLRKNTEGVVHKSPSLWLRPSNCL